MLEIINEFFSKESRIRNITVDELLKEYEIEEKLFWNYVYDFNLMTAEKIKKENQRRESNKNALEIYRLTKDGTLTFGDISRMKNKSIEEVIEALQNEYLNGINRYSFDAIQQQNIELLKQRKEFQIYFYFIEHEVTFEQLGKQFGLEESQVIYLFDSILDSELTKTQIENLFFTNKELEKKSKMKENKKRLYKLFVLTETERICIENTIEALKKESPELYEENITTLNYIKMRLTGCMPDTIACCNFFKVNPSTMQFRLNQLSNNKKFSTITTKISILNMINSKKIYTHSEEKIERIEYYMQFYADYLNNSNITISDIELQHGVNLRNGNLLDQELNTNIFSEISNKIEQLEEKMNSMSEFDNMVYKYYKNHFILFRDLAPLLDIEQEELQQYYSLSTNKNEWESICEIEHQRLSLIQKDIQKLVEFEELIDELKFYSGKRQNDTSKLSDKLSSLINNPSMSEQLETRNQPSYFRTLIKSAQFIRLYLKQENYDIKNLIENFQIKSRATEILYLYHPFVFNILNERTKQYIRVKRQIAHKKGLRRKQEAYLQNKSYECMFRNEKGQFVKKYQTPENTESNN